jgi:peroxiredoxin
VLEVGDHVPAVSVQRAPGDATTLAELAAGGTILLFFYLFDWSST